MRAAYPKGCHLRYSQLLELPGLQHRSAPVLLALARSATQVRPTRARNGEAARQLRLRCSSTQQTEAGTCSLQRRRQRAARAATHGTGLAGDTARRAGHGRGGRRRAKLPEGPRLRISKSQPALYGWPWPRLRALLNNCARGAHLQHGVCAAGAMGMSKIPGAPEEQLPMTRVVPDSITTRSTGTRAPRLGCVRLQCVGALT